MRHSTTIIAAALACWLLRASQAADPAPVSFANDVVPLFTKAGCNAGPCHAKAPAGQNGFRLSLLGFEPADDHEHLVTEGRGRRVSLVAPDESLLLAKASARVPHGGGRRLEETSAAYETLRRWIEEGARSDVTTAPAIEGLAVEPRDGTLSMGDTVRLRVVASYADGSTRDVTETALYESNDAARMTVDESGGVRVGSTPGRAAIMIRYQGRVAVAAFGIPQGPAVAVPPARNFVDELVFANLGRLGIPPSPPCDDATFLRRVSLDVTGSLPGAEAAREFLESTAADKRDVLVETLLRSPEYADFFANKWTALLKNRRDDASDMVSNFAFHAWVRDGLLANKRYDQLVRELLGATGTVVSSPPVAWYKRVKDPKEQIEDVAQLFLGVRMQCAQCHHHPFERWSQDDYYGLAAFFSQVGRKPSGVRGEDLIFHRRGQAGMANPRTAVTVRPAGLGTATTTIPPDDDPRLRLADWMADPANPFFAKALVNRYWKHFFGRGLVEPEDDIRETNPATNPELLDALASHFVASGFDLKALVRTIVQSRTYQLGEAVAANLADQQNFSHAAPRRLPAEVLLDALDRVAETTTPFANLPPGTRAIALPDNSYNASSAFLKVFGRPDNASACECERASSPSLAQSLHLINAGDVKTKLAADQGRAARYARDPRPAGELFRELLLVAYAREPRSEEVAIAEAYLADVGAAADPAAARRERFEDLVWAVVNTKEFLFNH